MKIIGKIIGALVVSIAAVFYLGMSALSFSLPDDTPSIIVLIRTVVSTIIVFGLPGYIFFKIIKSTNPTMSIETEEIKEEDIFISEKVDKSIDKINGVMGVVAIAIVFFIIFLLIVGMFANQLKNYSG